VIDLAPASCAATREKLLAWLAQLPRIPAASPVSDAALAPHLAETMTQKLAGFFERTLRP
jgi:hypothetical protein